MSANPKEIEELGRRMDSDPRALCTKRWLAQAFGLSENTVGKRLAGVEPDGRLGRTRSPGYRLATAAPHLLEAGAATHETDPARMPPADRIKFYDAERKRVEFEQYCGRLLEREAVVEAIARAVKMLSERLESVSDLAERRLGLTRKQTGKLVKIVDEIRGDFMARLDEEFRE